MAEQPDNTSEQINILSNQIESYLSSLVTDYKNCIVDPANLDSLLKALQV